MHASINMDTVLNSNPVKKLIIAFENLKTDYTEENAKEYMNLYKDQPLSFIIENSRYIFSEPMYGYEFYKKTIENPYSFLFTEYGNEYEKLSDYLDEYSNKMGVVQKTMYENLIDVLHTKKNDYTNTSVILNHAFLNESVKSLYDVLVQTVYEHDNYVINEKTEQEWATLVTESLREIESPDLFYALTPYMNKITDINGFIYENINTYFSECTIEKDRIDENEWKKFIESVIIVSKLYKDSVYVEAVNNFNGREKILLKSMAQESVKSQIDDLSIRYVNESSKDEFDCYYSTPNNAVNRIFQDNAHYSMFKDDNETIKTERTKLRDLSLNLLREYVEVDFYNSDSDTDLIDGYNFFENGESIEDAFIMISEITHIGEPSKTLKNYTSDYSEDFNKKKDNDKNESIKEKKTKKSNKYNNDDEDDDIDFDDEDEDDEPPKKDFAPKASLSRKIQHSAMDSEAKQYKKMADNKQKGHEIKNAIKAVTNIPSNISNQIKNSIKEWDEADDDKRRKYISEPGFRKKYFRNLKLAILYGATASVNPLLLPITFFGRHLSKEKNKRIRNEYIKELDTEIKVCEEKINDANYNGDKAEKYKLMRIKGKLEQQLYRVKTNSKYS